jgi:MtfA peptidase
LQAFRTLFYMDDTFYFISIALILIYLANVLRLGRLNIFISNECAAIFHKTDETERLRKVLFDNFIVYRKLGEKERKQFEKRVCRFISMKTFRAGNDIKMITNQMRLMVAASAVQITYGYPNVYFNHFETIILFADDYFSTITGNYHEGEVNAGGAIVLSWKSFISGFSDQTDGHNLALHEMAHALRLTNIVDNEEYDFIDRKIMNDFEELALKEMQKIDDGENPFFRTYGSTNLQEFFSVAVECFFEQSKEFMEYNPELYTLLTKILKLDLLLL